MFKFSQTDFNAGEREENPRKRGGENATFPFTLAALIFVFLMFLLVSAGCNSILSKPVPAQNLQSGTVLFRDDFSKTPSGWGIWNRDGAKVGYDKGGLRIQIDEHQFDFWSVSGHNFGDAQIEVDAAKLSGPDDNDFGIICRYRSKENFYLLIVSSDGYYGIAEMKAGQYSMIGSEQLQYSSLIAQGQAVNHLRADCVGSTLRLYANGTKLMEANNPDFSSGDVGVLAGSYNGNGVDIVFDNFTVKKP